VPAEEGWPEGSDVYGLFASERKGRNALKRLAERHGICHALLGLAPEPCRLSRVERLRHLARLAAAAAPLKLPRWPYAGPIAVRERRDLHLFDRWGFLGTARSAAETHELLKDRPPRAASSTYEILSKALPRLRQRTAELSGTAPSILRAAEPDPPDFP
jgi:DNA polymerase-3 subunit epsilon